MFDFNQLAIILLLNFIETIQFKGFIYRIRIRV